MSLEGKRVAIAVANEFDEQEFEQPYERLKREGASIVIVGVEENQRLVSHHRQKEIVTEKSFQAVSADDFDALIIPGGYSHDKLRLSQKAIEFIQEMNKKGKLIAAICHGPSLLISADIVKGKTLTAWPSIVVDLKNAGANVVDAEVVSDGNLITSRSVSDLPVFIKTLIDILEGKASMPAAS